MAAGFVEEKAMSRLDVEENELLPVLVSINHCKIIK